MDLARISAGQALPPRERRPVTRSDIVKYQGASGDFDAAHHDDDHARSFGFPGADEMGNMLQVYRDFEKEVTGLRDTSATRKIYPGLLTFDQFLAKYKDQIPR